MFISDFKKMMAEYGENAPVNRRARALPAEYRKKLGVLDGSFSGTRPGEVGPCVARLKSLGSILELVVGAFGEVSPDLDRTVTALAE